MSDAVTKQREIINKYKERIYNSKNEEERKRNIIDMRLYACKRLSKIMFNLKDIIDDDLVEECLEVMKMKETKYGQKEAARAMLNLKFGEIKTNNMIEEFAIVNKRSDSLVVRWRKEVIKRDKKCQYCGSEEKLHAHHISKWSDDPVNRINLDNGITLCEKCHSEQHLDIRNFILRKKAKYE